MGRLAWYAGISTALATGVVVSAFNQRPNFYSACVYLSQSNLCLMILINLILFIYGSFMYGLQRLCYGSLRPIEIEQLYEKAWFAITETCLAMTIFREEVGAWFLVMFVALLTGKVWGWIGDGRVEVLEQQPPANPRLFHIRLIVSLTMSIIYDIFLMKYTINTVIQQARPNMMVMFLFEFAVLTTCSFATWFRYCISLIETNVVKKQTKERLAERRREVREERAEAIRQREAAAAAAVAAGEGNDAAQSNTPLPSEDDVDEMDIEVPGWEAKGQWVLTLDLVSDFIKLGIYVTFFVILFMFYGLPIHIIRDLFLTARSFTKRLAAFLRYRRATQDMNKRYEDATVEDIQREDTCIICREEMRPWSVTNPQTPPAAPGGAPPTRPASSVNERSRPKKLPCGHILHLGCLKSWLERQQVCPTCRAPVVDNPQAQAPRGPGNDANAAVPGAPAPAGQQDGPAPPAPPAARPAGRGMRMLNLGPLRVGFGQANLEDLAQGVAPQPNQANGVAGGPRVYGLELGFPRRAQAQAQPPQAPGTATQAGAETTLQDQIQHIEQQIVAEIRTLQLTQQELQLVQLLQVELARLRALRNGGADASTTNFQMPQMAPLVTRPATQNAPFPSTVPQMMQRHGVRPNTAAIPSGSADLPPGVTIPEGWSLLPLQRLDGLGTTVANEPQSQSQPAAPFTGRGADTGSAPTATTQTDTHPFSPMGMGTVMGRASNNNLTPTATLNPDHQLQTSSADSSDTNAISTPPSVATGQSLSSTGPRTALPSSSLNNTPASIASSDANQNPSLFPTWGSSQLFSGPSLNPGTAMATSSAMAPPPTSQDPQGGHVAIDGQHADAHGDTATAAGGVQQQQDNKSASSAPGEAGPRAESEEEPRPEKGKARAATVEDSVDEAEGS